MIRSFIALSLPESVRSQLVLAQYTLPLPRKVEPENMHLTLVFLGKLANPDLEEVHSALEMLRAPGFSLRLQGIGLFGGARPHNLHAQVIPQPGLEHLQAKVVQAVRKAGVAVESRRFVPHVTLGRFKPEEVDVPRLARAVAQASLFRTDAFEVAEFGLYRSVLTRSGPTYDALAHYPLTPPAPSG